MTARLRDATYLVLGLALLPACRREGAVPPPPFAAVGQVSRASIFWNGATVYFLLTDRFVDGDSANDHAAGRAHDGGLLRNFEGGDLKGVLRKINEGYFDSLGITALWMTPFVEQVHGSVDEGAGKTYGYHGYWTLDWTAVDPGWGTKEDLHAVVDAAHRHGMRVLMDAVLNHPGPVTPEDPAWPDDWVRTQPQCTYRSYVTTVTCTLVRTLPDIRTDRDEPVDLPPALVEKWRREGRLEQERASLDAFFRRTGYPRAPRFYLIKWLTDWVRGFGFDGYRVDTAKHFEESASDTLKIEADVAFADWKRAHPDQVLDSLPFYMMGEVFGWAPESGRLFGFGDRWVDYFSYGYDGLINFAFKSDARWPMDSLFTTYDRFLQGPLQGEVMLNYISSHDDGGPFDPERSRAMDAGTRLLLAPGGAQVYYGDETARPLRIAGAQADANLRGMMNWSDLTPGSHAAEVLAHWRKLGRFRAAHPAVGAGVHRTLQASPYIFSRTLDTLGVADTVLIAMDQPAGAKTIPVFGTFAEGAQVVDGYSGATGTVRNGSVALTTPSALVLLASPR